MAVPFLIVALLGALALPAAAATPSTDPAARFGRFLEDARAAGSFDIRVRYRGDSKSGCSAAETCGVAGEVHAHVDFDPDRRVRDAGDGVAVLPGKGTVTAGVRHPGGHCRG